MVDGLGRWRTSNTETEDAAQRQLPIAEDEHGLCSMLSLVLSLSLTVPSCVFVECGGLGALRKSLKSPGPDRIVAIDQIS